MTALKSRRILVTRPQPAASEFADKLKDEGFEVFLAPMTEYVEIDNTPKDMADYQGLIFTSIQGVNIFAAREPERYIAVFAVGEATAHAAEKAGFRRINVAAGDGDAVVQLIRREKSKYGLKRVLHPCGEDTAQDITAALKGDGVYVDRLPIYKARFTSQLPMDVSRALLDGEITTVTLFSARTAANFVKLLQEPELKDISSSMEAVCLSDRVAAEIKGVPWRVLRVAKAPHLESVLDILRTREEPRAGGPVLQAEPVIEAFGGLRPLATALGITASTVQGWRSRGVIPEARADAVFNAARAAKIDYSGFMSKPEGNSPMNDSKNGSDGRFGDVRPDATPRPGETAVEAAKRAKAEEVNNRERRRLVDRRQKHTPVDNRGNVVADSYNGPDRRRGKDRRSYHARQASRIRSEKWYFVNRSIIMSSIFTMAVLYAGGFLMAPEFFDWRQKESQETAMQSRMDEMNNRLLAMQQAQQSRSLGNALSHRIEQVQDAADAVSSTVGSVGDVAQGLASQTEVGRGVSSVLQVLSNLKAMNQTKAGRDAASTAMGNLKGALAASPTDLNGLNSAVAAAAGRDKNLQKIFTNVHASDLGAAALLLTLNEFRNNVNTQKPFQQDLLLMQKYTGASPEMQKSLNRLAPYAQNGVLNRQALQGEFQGLAGDIVMAKLQGQDINVQQQVMARLGKLVKVRRIDDVKGSSVDSVVARAQLKLNGNDVRGAMQELQTLDGAPAQTAAPFMEQAAGNVMADDAMGGLVQMIMEKFSDPSSLTADGISGIVDQVKGMMGGIGDSIGSGMGGGGGTSPSIYVSPGMYAGPQTDDGGQ
ncbi:MAG: uroporphyrinogen-III synthase [Micavibrio sp.]|nr:uroporphyrinogen-III synthase [Micavibrio sp.]